MASAELAFEYLAAALESTRGTAVTPPTHYFPFTGGLTPQRTKFRPEEQRGTKFKNYREKTTRAGAEWSAEGAADPNYLPFFLNMAVKAVSSPSTPSGATLSRLWTFTPSGTTDDLKSATLYSGDPNVKIWQSAYAMLQTLSIESDAGSEDGVTMSIDGIGKFPTALGSNPTLPSQSVGSILVPGAMQMWLDVGSDAIGTTEITGRFLSTSWEIPTGVTPKYYAQGPANDLSFTRVGIEKIEPKAEITVELNDASFTSEYSYFAADTPVKMRIRLNGDKIETVTSVDWYEYVQLDIYGTLGELSWEEVEGVNRAMKFEIMGIYNSTLGAPFSIAVQNAKTSI